MQDLAQTFRLSIDGEVVTALQNNAVVAIGVSGGKDSSVVAIQTHRFLDAIRHTGERLLLHSDLGLIEHADSMRHCEKLSAFLKLPLLTVRRKQGGLIERWEQRWESNWRRYVNLECVTLITPWSTPKLRFCTGELKSQVISRELATRYPGQQIINVIGIRRAESSARARKPISQLNPKLKRASGSHGIDWHPILDWTTQEVFDFHKEVRFPLHFAYSNGNSRVSCSFCILSSIGDLRASFSDQRNHPAWQRLSALELESAFSFQSNRWLTELSPNLIDRIHLAEAQAKARTRQAIEAQIPASLRFTKGWPTSVPTYSEATTLASIRSQIAGLYQKEVGYTTAKSVEERYAELQNQSR